MTVKTDDLLKITRPTLADVANNKSHICYNR